MSSVTVTTNVTSDASSKTLDVKDHGAPVDVPQETDVTNLVWQLTGSAAQGSFNAIDLTNEDSGFYWIDTPPSGIFGTPALAANGNQITMTDNNNGNNNGNSTAGTWRYKLNATIGGQQYSTTATITATTSDPKIKNT